MIAGCTDGPSGEPPPGAFASPKEALGSTGDACQVGGDCAGAICLATWEDRRVCTVGCAGSPECPAGWACRFEVTLDGTREGFCAPERELAGGAP